MFIRSLPFLISITRKIMGEKLARFLLSIITRKEQFYHIDSIYDFDKKKAVTRLTLSLPGKGCAWAKKTGGCTMCGFSQKIKKIGRNFTDKDLIALYRIAELMTIKDKPFLLTIYNAGSFINDCEISPWVQKEIYQRVKNHSTIEKLFIESRAEFITEDKIKGLKHILGNKQLIMAIGLEAQDDKVRNNYIHKGLSKKMYEKAIKVIKENGEKSLTYVFIKPLFLNEQEAIEEAVNTAKYAFRVGSDEVAFESAFVQEETMMEKLYRERKFKPPWLWSIIEVIKRTHHLGNIHIGGFEDEPPPIAIPSNCPKCSKTIREALQKYRETHNVDLLLNLSCSCKKDWREIIKF